MYGTCSTPNELPARWASHFIGENPGRWPWLLELLAPWARKVAAIRDEECFTALPNGVQSGLSLIAHCHGVGVQLNSRAEGAVASHVISWVTSRWWLAVHQRQFKRSEINAK